MPLQGGKKKKGLIYDLHLVNSMKIGKIDVNLFQVFKYDKLLFQHFSSILTRRNIENPAYDIVRDISGYIYECSIDIASLQIEC